MSFLVKHGRIPFKELIRPEKRKECLSDIKWSED